VPLLSRVSGLSSSVARSVVRWRDANGAFRTRKQLLEVTGLGPKAFEQSAGFLRIREGDDPLDVTGVHPETYPLVQKMLERTGKTVRELMGRAELLRSLKPEAYADERFGVVTVRDILAELEKPGRDPRPDFKVARFNEGISDIADLKPGMLLEGTVSNVAAFGAFVDIGVHQDGLIHVSQLSARFVQDAHEVVKTGDIVKVRVLEVDLPRKRISLSMKPAGQGGGAAREDTSHRHESGGGRGVASRGSWSGGTGRSHVGNAAAGPTAMADAFARLKRD